VLENPQTLGIPETYLTLSLGAPPAVFGEGNSGKWTFSGKLCSGDRVTSIAGSFGPSGVCSLALPNVSFQDPGLPYLKGYKNVLARRTLLLRLDRSVSGRPVVTASVTITLGTKETTLAPNPAVVSGRLLPVISSYAATPERSTFLFEGPASVGISGGVATGYLSAGRLMLVGVGAGYEVFSAGVPTTIFEKTLSVDGGDGGALFAKGVVPTARPGVAIGVEVEFFQSGRITGTHRKANWGTGVFARTTSVFSDDISRRVLGYPYTSPVGGVFKPFLAGSLSDAKLVFDDFVGEGGVRSTGGSGGVIRWQSSQLSIVSSGASFASNGKAWKFDARTGFFSGEHGVSGAKLPRKFSGVILQSGPLAASVIADDGRSGSAAIVGDTPSFLPSGYLPTELSLLAGSSADLDVKLTGTNLVYRWFKRSNLGEWLEVSTEKTNRFRFVDVDWSDGGEYRVVVYNRAHESMSEEARKASGKQIESTCRVRVLTATAKPVLAWVQDATGIDRYVIVDVEIEAARPPVFTESLTVPAGMPAFRYRLPVDGSWGLVGSLKFSMAPDQLPGASVSPEGDLTLAGALFRDVSDRLLAFRVNVSEDPAVYSYPEMAAGRVLVSVVETPKTVTRRHLLRMGSGVQEIVWDDALGGVGGGTTLTEIASYSVGVPGSPRVNESGNLEFDTDLVATPGRHSLSVILDWAGETTAALLEIEYVGLVGDRVPDFVVHRNLTSRAVGAADAVMTWDVGAEVFPRGIVESGGVSFEGAIWKFSSDTETGDIYAEISPEGQVTVRLLPSEGGPDTVDFFVSAESDELEKRLLRGVIRFHAVRPVGPAVNFRVYRGGLSPRVNGLAGVTGVRSPVVVRDGGDLFRLMQLRWDGTVGADSSAIASSDLPAVSRGIFEILDTPVSMTGRLVFGDRVVRDVGNVGDFQLLVGSVLTGFGIPLGASVESVSAASKTVTLSLPAEFTGDVSMLAESRVSYVAVDLMVNNPGARLEWTIPSNPGRLRLNIAQALRDSVQVGSGGNVADGTSVLAGLRSAGVVFSRATEGEGFSVSADGVLELLDLAAWSGVSGLSCPVTAVLSDGTETRVDVILKRAPEDFSLSVALVPGGEASVGFSDRISERGGAVQLQQVSVRSIQARRVSGLSMTPWERLRDLNRVGEVVSSAFVPRAAYFGSVYYSGTSSVLSLGAAAGDVVFLQESQPKVVRGVSDADFSGDLLTSTLPGALVSVSGLVQVGDVVSLIDSAYPGWDGVFRVVNAGGATTGWSLSPLPTATEGFYQVLRKGSSKVSEGNPSWVMVRRQRAARISRELDATWLDGKLVANAPSVLGADAGTLEVGTPVVVAGQADGSMDGLYSVADLGSVENPWVLVRHLSASFAVPSNRMSWNLEQAPDASSDFVVSATDALSYREGDLVKVNGELDDATYRLSDKSLYVFAKVSTGFSASSPEVFVERAGVISGVEKARLPEGVAGSFGTSSNIFVAPQAMVQGVSGDSPSLKVGDGFRVTFTGDEGGDDGSYRVVGVISRFVKVGKVISLTVEQSGALGGSFSGNLYEVSALPGELQPNVGERVFLPGLRDSRYEGTRMEAQGGMYVVLAQPDLAGGTWLMSREPNQSELSFGKTAGFAGLSYIEEGGVVTVSSNNILVDGRLPLADEWLSDGTRGVYEVSRINQTGSTADSLVLSQVLSFEVDQGGAMDFRRPLNGGEMAGVGVDVACRVAGSVDGLVTISGQKVIEVDSTSGLSAGMILSGVGVPDGAWIEEVLDERRLRMGVVATSSGIGGVLDYGYETSGRIQVDLLPASGFNEDILVTVLRGGQTVSIDLADYLGLYYGGEHRFDILGSLPSFFREESLRKGVLTGASTTDGSTLVVVPSTSLLGAGMYVFGGTIPLGARVSKIINGTSFEMDLPAAGSASGLGVSYVSTLLQMKPVPADWASNEEVLLYRLQSGGRVSYGKVVVTVKDPAFSVRYVGVAGGDPEIVQITKHADFLKFKREQGLVDPVYFTLDPGAPAWLSVSSRGAVLFDCRGLKDGVEQASARVRFIDSREDRVTESGTGEGFIVFEVKKPVALSEFLRLSAGQGTRQLALSHSSTSGVSVAPQVRILGAQGASASVDGFGKLRITPPSAGAPSFEGSGIRMSSASGLIDDESTGDSYVYAGEPYVLIEAIGSKRTDWSYQWMKNGVPIAGANGAQLVLGLGVTEEQGIRIGGMTVNDEGMYSLVASNAYGRAESSGLHLRVLPRAFIVDPPPSPLIKMPSGPGSRVTLSVVAAGANLKPGQYIYRWYFTGSDKSEVQIPYEDDGGESDGWILNRSTAWQLVVEDFSPREEGEYRVEVVLSEEEELSDARESNERRWKLWSRPTIVVQPQSLFGLEGDSVVFRVQVNPEIHPSPDQDDKDPAPFLAASQVRWFKRVGGAVTQVGFGDTLSFPGDGVSKLEMDEAVFYVEITDPNDTSYKLLSKEVRLRIFERPMGLESENDGIAGHEMRPVTFDNGSSSYRMNVSTTETTLGQWKMYVEDTSETWMSNRQNGSSGLKPTFWMKPGFPQDDTHPVVNVSWEEARDYCNWLSQRTGYRWRMMTSPEWTTLTQNNGYPWDGSWPPRAMSGNLSRAVPTADDGYLFTSPAAMFNPLGDIFGLGGNVSEWLDEAYYEVRVPGGVRYERGFRSFVGPSWATRDKSIARASYRGRAAVGYRDNRVGFRVVAENLDFRSVPYATLMMGDDVTPAFERRGFEPVVEFVSGLGSGAVGEGVFSGADLVGVTVKSGGTGYSAGDLPVVTVRWRSLPEMPDHPAHRVKVPAVEVGKTEVTWLEWNTVASWAVVNGYVFDGTPDAFGDSDSLSEEYKDYHPVHSVTWWDAIKWCNARSEMEGLTPCYYTADGTVYRGAGRPRIFDSKTKRLVDDEMRDEYVKWSANGYRLPTEAEWEKAAREGTQGAPFAFGNRAVFVRAFPGVDDTTITVSDETPFQVGALVFGEGIEAGTLVVSVEGNVVTLSNSSAIEAGVSIGVYRFGRVSPDFETQAVTGLAKSGFGLRGMLGSVREWCWDWYSGYDTTASASYRGTRWDSTPRVATYSLSPATGVASVVAGSVASVTMDTDVLNDRTAMIKVVVNGGHGYRNGDTVIFRTLLHPQLNGTYEGITVVDESTFVFSWHNTTGGTWSPIIDSTDGTVTKLMSQRVYRGGGWDSASANDSRVYARDREPLMSVASATTLELGVFGVGGTLESTSNARLVIDGQSPEIGDRILVKDQSNSELNGVYIVQDVGSDTSHYKLVRDSLFDESLELSDPSKHWVTVRNGTANAKTVWRASVEVNPVIGTSPILYSRQSGYASPGLGFRVVRLQR
jgi:formylglycine-generating enzyme required for sulfatase activity